MPSKKIPNRPQRRNSKMLLWSAGGGLLLTGLLASGAWIWFSQPRSAEQYYQRALTERDQGQIKEAIIDLKNSLKLDPRQPNPRILLGELQLRQGDLQSAEKELRTVLQIDGNNERAQALLLDLTSGQHSSDNQKIRLEGLKPQEQVDLLVASGNGLLSKNQADNASKQFEEALRIDPNSLGAYLGLAHAALLRGDTEQFTTHLAKLESLDSKNAQVALLRGDWKLRQGDVAGAEQDYSTAIAQDARMVEAIIKRGLVRVQQKRPAEVRQDAKRLAEIEPKHPAAPLLFGMAAQQENNLNEAEQQFRAALQQGDYLPAWRQLALLQLQKKSYPEAEISLRKVLGFQPDDLAFGKLLAEVLMRQFKLTEASALLDSLAKNHPGDSGVIALRSSLALKQGDSEAAQTQLNQLSSASKSPLQSHWQEGMINLANGQFDAAIKSLRQAQSEEPDQPLLQLALAQAHLGKRDVDAALPLAQSLQKKFPEQARIQALIGAILATKGDYNSAQAAFAKALELEPGDPDSSHQLAKLALINKDPQGARRYYEAALARHPQSWITAVRLAGLSELEGHPDDAEQRLRKAVSDYPLEIPVHQALALSLFRHGKTDEALTHLSDLTLKHGNDFDALTALAELQRLAGRHVNAAETYRTLAEKYPSPNSYYQLADAELRNQNYHQARQALAQAEKMSGAHPQLTVSRIRIALLEGDLAAAEKLLGELVGQSKGENGLTHRLRGEIALARKQPLEAAHAFEKSLAVEPNPDLAIALIQNLNRAGKGDEARSATAKWLKRFPDHAGLRVVHAEQLMLQGADEQAIAVYQGLLKSTPQSPAVLNNLAYLHIKRDPKAAVSYAEQAAKLAPGSAEIADTHGWALLHAGAPEQALPILQQALQKTPNNPSIGYHLAAVQQKLGDSAAAKQLLSGLIEQKFPEQAEAQALYQKLP
ncbi:MAG TPA: PEP-CTERM system TPR-repeat protein PrsT [Pseudomonadales bacterium]|jgi:putative PEP-CTERM system TPR-repeat lipoprotein|nr:PEP-CTERM system TPR-repeat protein PrsT [Pseudomonadales bacterium]HMW83545.1 PEP-CTERM system TPR-repeat protein PrsT [Pseudomonadales bacterium]HMZ70056.1 PEP-CTERM system TPR-repeat protein PrsT [Pseudomonadales bacterium]HNB83397.1 PEP-CTERM system TPR-repeat protein PrsT [Pseudomonadales bacterium]HNC76288.1 PEP-CTERM system TPR-repeat protein PrsT [Pseudomonadales bacterium]